MAENAPAKGGTEAHSGVKRASQLGVPRFTAVSGPGAGRSFVMTSALATVGRHATNDLVLADPGVSAVHLHVRRQASGFTSGTRRARTERGSGRIGSPRSSSPRRRDRARRARACGSISTTAPSRRVVSPDESFGELVGESTPMRELFATLGRVAPKNIGLLLQGETGTGKEEIARALHARSPRAAEPFVVIDATSLPETLAESLLFGHEKGAFTGATEKRIGLFEAAHRGTVLLDEIGELPAALQAKFLRVLERYEFSRVGGNTPVKVDVSVIAATHRDLRNESTPGAFARTSTFGSPSSASRFRRSATGSRTSRSSAGSSWRRSPETGRSSSSKPRSRTSRRSPGRGTYASFATSSRAPPRSARTGSSGGRCRGGRGRLPWDARRAERARISPGPSRRRKSARCSGSRRRICRR